MPILNYTTEVSAMKTVGQIQAILARNGAVNCQVEFWNGEPEGLAFAVTYSDELVQFRLPCRAENILKLLEQDKAVPKRLHSIDQVRRVAWRIIKDWVSSQMALIQAEQASFFEVFLAYALDSEGKTLGQRIVQNPKLLTTARG